MAEKIKTGHIVGGLIGIGALGGIIYVLTRPAVAQPRFRVADLVISPEVVTVGELVTISVTVTNVGTAPGIYEVVCQINGVIERGWAELNPGESQIVTLYFMPPEPRIYQVSVDGLRGSFTAVELPIEGRLVIAYAIWEGKGYWNPILEENTWPGNIEITTAWEVENTGTQTAIFKVSFMGLESAGVELEPGGKGTLYLYLMAQEGTFTLQVLANGQVVDERSITIKLEVPVAEFQVSDLVISPPEVYVGEPVTISVTVTNVGTAPGTYEVVCEVK